MAAAKRKESRKEVDSRQSGITPTPSPDAYWTNWLPLPSPSLSLSLQTILENQHKVQKMKTLHKNRIMYFFTTFASRSREKYYELLLN